MKLIKITVVLLLLLNAAPLSATADDPAGI